MKKRMIIAFFCSCMIGITACGTQEPKEKTETQNIVSEVESSEEGSSKDLEEDLTEESVDRELLDASRVIDEQSFDVELDNWGKVKFVSYLPQGELFEDVSFVLEKEGEIIYTFPYYYENNNTQNSGGLFDSVAAVSFRDLNNDNMQDVVVIINYVTGAGPQGMLPRPRVRIFLADEEGYCVGTDLMKGITENISERDLTIKAIYEYIGSR